MTGYPEPRRTPSTASMRSTRAGRKDYLVFRLAERQYGVALERILELRHYDVVQPLPTAPRIIAGVLNRGGRRVAVVNLHELLGLGHAAESRLCDVVLLHDGDRVCGIAVDCVIDVVLLDADSLNAAASGVVTVGERVITLLDADDLMIDVHSEPAESIAA